MSKLRMSHHAEARAPKRQHVEGVNHALASGTSKAMAISTLFPGVTKEADATEILERVQERLPNGIELPRSSHIMVIGDSQVTLLVPDTQENKDFFLKLAIYKDPSSATHSHACSLVA